jgi:hypothetical protein
MPSESAPVFRGRLWRRLYQAVIHRRFTKWMTDLDLTREREKSCCSLEQFQTNMDGSLYAVGFPRRYLPGY